MIETLRLIHVSLALVSISGFILRGIWMLLGSPILETRVVRFAPHVIDTLFLISGVCMLLVMRLSLLDNDWLIAKLIALLIYIVLGAIALRRGPTLTIRSIAFALAVGTFAYIVGVAISKSPLSWLAL